MIFQKGYIYHIYSQGNNHRNIFLVRENYLYFLEKLRDFILPYSDILAWFLMPNHFHLMVKMNEVELPKPSQGVTWSHPLTKSRTLNQSIGIMIRSYTRAINQQEGFSGSLFREETKADCLNCPESLAKPYFLKQGITHINITDPARQYLQVCFHYIHQNPVKARLVKEAVCWEFSSARDYAGLRNGKLINKEVAGEYLDIRWPGG
jgi:putative transposase